MIETQTRHCGSSGNRSETMTYSNEAHDALSIAKLLITISDEVKVNSDLARIIDRIAVPNGDSIEAFASRARRLFIKLSEHEEVA
jgi:hypothetical protein